MTHEPGFTERESRFMAGCSIVHTLKLRSFLFGKRRVFYLHLGASSSDNCRVNFFLAQLRGKSSAIYPPAH